jgi:NAD(P) transhydrogenase
MDDAKLPIDLTTSPAHYDLLVIGSGPGGQKAAIAAAKLGKRVAVVERESEPGGVCVNTGTIPSKTMREAAIYLSGISQRDVYGQSYRLKEDVTMQDLGTRVAHVVAREVDVVRNQLARNHVSLVHGTARFVDAHTVAVVNKGRTTVLTFERLVLAVGTRPARPAGVAFDGETVIDSDSMLTLDRLPKRLVVVGAGVIGMEYASMMATLGVDVTVVEQRARMLEFCDDEIVEALQYHLRALGVTFRFGETVASVETGAGRVLTHLDSGKTIVSDTVLYSAGRQGCTEALGLECAGLAADARGRISVDENFRTSVPNIYAVGDVIGFPALAATAMEQGRLAACHAFAEPAGHMSELVPIGIYTVPEISYVGRTEHELTAAGVPYEAGIARYRELARGQILGDVYGVLKLLVGTDDRSILGVHVFGVGATELVHIGQTAMGTGATVDYFVDAVFNHPTLAEAYKVAALDATNKLRLADMTV